MRRVAFAVVVPFAAGLVFAQAPLAAPAPYFPSRFEWQSRRPEDVGLDPAGVAAAVQIAIEHETKGARDMRRFLDESFGKEPNHAPIGPVFDGGGAAGVIVRHGYRVASWGDCARPDMCNSVTKTFLTTVVGLLWHDGLVHDVQDRVRPYMPAGVTLFDAEHNQPITWDHLLRQTSDWQGELWGKHDWQDRPEGRNAAEWEHCPRWVPGTHYEYNDVRVNVLALAALHVARRPLPEVLRERVMDPIGASSTWRWHGYDNAWLDLDGRRVQSVSGGGHWGGGLCIGADDLARFGLLCLRQGRWGERQLVRPEWLAMARTPGGDNRGYGYANWFLTPDRKALPNAPASAVRFLGNGGNIVYVDWENDLVVVVRWLDGGATFDQLLGKLLLGIAAGR